METLAFIGGGNMARAILGGLLAAGRPAASLVVVEPGAAQRQRLQSDFGLAPLAAADARLKEAALVVWAVKPQMFREAAAPCAAYVSGALQLSVMAGVRSEAIAAASGSDRVVRAMPNTPALIGRGIAGLYARPAVTAPERQQVEALLAPTGESLWVERESALDAVTALSGSGPAYVFYVVEAMVQAGVGLGLEPAQARRLALATLGGATALAEAATESPQQLREQVTSKGGTTEAAIRTLEERGVKAAFIAAIEAAERRARELGDEFGA